MHKQSFPNGQSAQPAQQPQPAVPQPNPMDNGPPFGDNLDVSNRYTSISIDIVTDYSAAQHGL